MTQLRRGVLEHAVLALVEARERYGYDLVVELSESGLVASEGSVYPLLARLRADELVVTTWQESESGPPRRYYRLTPAGRAALGEFRESWARFSAAVDGVLGSTARGVMSDASAQPGNAPPAHAEVSHSLHDQRHPGGQS